MSLPFEAARFAALRKLAEERFGGIGPVETEILRRAGSIENNYPVKTDDRPEIAAHFLRWLATDKDAATHLDPLGIRVANVTVTSTLDFDFCKVPVRVDCRYCTFEKQITLRHAEIPSLYLQDCRIEQGIAGDGLNTSGNIFLRRSEVNGEVRMVTAQIGADLDCEGATFTTTGDALNVDRAKIAGDVFLENGFSSMGRIMLGGADIGGDLDCQGAKLKKTNGEALTAEAAKIAGNTYFNHGFASAGTINLLGTQIGGDLDCQGAALNVTGQALHAESAKVTGSVYLNQGFTCPGIINLLGAQISGNLDCTDSQIAQLTCDSAHISGFLYWASIRKPEESKLWLFDANVGTLHDDRKSWPKKGNLRLLDFIYKDLVLHEERTAEMVARNQAGPTIKLTAEDRLEWLRRQTDGDLDHAQSWMQLSKLLDENGDADGAKQVVYEYHRHQAAVEDGPLRRVGSMPFDLLAEDPMLVAYPILALGAVGSFFFWRASRIQAMALADKEAQKQFEATGIVPAGQPPFSPVVYAVENVLPVVKLGQDGAWGPNHQAPDGNWLPERPVWLRKFFSRKKWMRYITRLSYQRLAVLRWTLILLGWALALILAAAIGDRFKS